MNTSVNYDILIKGFCESVIKQLYARHALGTDYRNKVALTIACFREIEKDPKKCITVDGIEKYYDGFAGLQEPKNKPDDYGVDNWMFSKVIDVLWSIKDYYNAPANKYNQQKLEDELREYFIGVSSNPISAAFYRFMPMTQIVKKLQKQK